ncbi:MAG: ACT domain-containing protein [Clostridiales bacterium]|nr:ACT domain-containing protein [Clostridiales bacterium]
MWAISIADTTNFGILRIIVDDPDKAVDVMRNAGYTVSTTEVLAVEVPDQPGGLHQVLDILRKEGISIEYLYSFVRRPAEKALILFKVDCLNDAVDILKRTGISVLTNDQVCGL